MGQYTKEEIKVFQDKELRIVRQAILKKLIEKCKLEDVYEVNKVTELSEKYVDYVYEERKDATKRGQTGCVAGSTEHKVNWEQIAIGLNLAIPNAENIKILNQVIYEYKKAHKASANPKDVLAHIISVFGRYPAKTESVEKVVSSFLKGEKRWQGLK